MSWSDEIDAKYSQLKQNGFDLGAKQGDAKMAGIASEQGWVQIYDDGRIYWGPNTGAYEVHGAILDRYLQLGGPGDGSGTNAPTTFGNLGFPTSDENQVNDPEDIALAFSNFQRGVIYWLKGVGAVSIFGDFHSQMKWGGPFSDFSLRYLRPLTEPISLNSGGEIVFFTNNLAVFKSEATNNELIGIIFLWPGSILKSLIFRSDNAINLSIVIRVNEITWNEIHQKHPYLLRDLCEKRFFLQSTGQQATKIELVPPSSSSPEHIPSAVAQDFSIPLLLKNSWTASDSTLYDIVILTENGRTKTVKSHNVYIKENWDNFGFIHATDLHVSRRIDLFKNKLIQAGESKGAANLNNWNDAFRDLIREANQLHETGEIDFILATGDLIDYGYEHDGDYYGFAGRASYIEPYPPTSVPVPVNGPTDKYDVYSWHPVEYPGGNNLDFLHKLILGQVPYPDSEDSPHEELKVPIFATLGNHDYRSHPYPLDCIWRATLDGPGPLDPGVKKIRLSQYAAFNLTFDEALTLMGGHGPMINNEEAAKLLKVSLARMGGEPDIDYLIELGPHRIVMLNTRQDAGIFEDIWDAIGAGLEIGATEDEINLAKSAPNSIGISGEGINKVKIALEKAGNQGLVIVGLHAPPLNPKGNEYPHYFRETEHETTLKKEIFGYLFRNGMSPGPGGGLSKHLSKEWQLGWPINMSGKCQTPYFKTGGIDNLLDWGIASWREGKTEEFLKLCVGEGNNDSRKIDLILFGHVHKNVEYRLEWDDDKDELRFFMDFYTENPIEYYRSYKYGFDEPVRVYVSETANTTSIVRTEVDPDPDAFWKEWKAIDVPPYRDPLNETSKPKRQWWDEHRPLLLQTGPLGPTDQNVRREENKAIPGPSFQGFRVISVKDNTIDKIFYVTRNEPMARGIRKSKEPLEPRTQWLEPVLSIMMSELKETRWLEPVLIIMMS